MGPIALYMRLAKVVYRHPYAIRLEGLNQQLLMSKKSRLSSGWRMF